MILFVCASLLFWRNTISFHIESTNSYKLWKFMWFNTKARNL